jgi:hypothetical protein
MTRRKGRSMSPRERERQEARYRMEMNRMRAAKGLPPLEPTPERGGEPALQEVRHAPQPPVPHGDGRQLEGRPSSARPAPPTPRRQETRYCPRCHRDLLPFDFHPPESLVCRACLRPEPPPGVELRGVRLP